jgi:hypothetical protein
VAGDKLSVRPNPVTNYMTITISTNTTGNGTLQLFESGGKLVKQMNISIQAGTNTLQMIIPDLANGYYKLVADWGNGIHKSFILAKQ